MKVFYLTNGPTPYKIQFWENMGRYCELEVLLEVEHSKERDSSWKSEIRNNYTELVLPSLFRMKTGAFCPAVRKYLIRKDGLVVINGYNTLSGMYAIVYSKLHHLPYVISCDGGIIKIESGIIKSIKRFLLRGASGYLSSGNMTDKYLLYYGAEKEKIGHYPFSSVTEDQVLPRALSEEEKQNIRHNLGITEKQILISVGQFIHRKGIDVLLKACIGMDKEIGVYIIGGEPPEEYLRVVNENGLDNVHFIPFIQPNDLRQYYCASDLFILPTREDVWGLVVNEAMAAGLPVITTTNCVAGVEMIRNGDTGILINPDDVENLRNAISKILTNRDLKQFMSENALSRAQDYTIEKMALETINYLKTIELETRNASVQ